ncbi:hypothetical protein FOZ62_004594 [Perkinsus olseni]|uniref:Uncharacterized protein n=1 Tax=Perkinsus olseni TaxID=32597 RepID=A0A7J6RJX0_PEROL|nr:hypothetical protein FOZ62_004594 [Perkinsus olseni]
MTSIRSRLVCKREATSGLLTIGLLSASVPVRWNDKDIVDQFLGDLEVEVLRYGGAIECLIPKGFADSSTVRTIPDYQEVCYGLDPSRSHLGDVRCETSMKQRRGAIAD